MIAELEHLIRQRAHTIWEREGQPQGRAEAHWRMAHAELAAEQTTATRPAPARRAKPASAAPDPSVATPKRRKAKATEPA